MAGGIVGLSGTAGRFASFGEISMPKRLESLLDIMDEKKSARPDLAFGLLL